MRKHCQLLIMVTGLLLGFGASAEAYTDQITVKAPEAWAAAQEAVKSYGIKKKDDQKFYLETKWITDKVVRRRGMFKKYTSEVYQRRYRLSIRVIQRDYDSEIQVKGTFQERLDEEPQHLYMWRRYKPESEDYDVERHVFMQIINRIELARTAT